MAAKLKKPTITIWRRGQFGVPGLVAHNQCGRLGQKEFFFNIEITVQRLDNQGFVCDNFLVSQAFNDFFAQGEWEASCEQLAGTAIYILKRLCADRALKVVASVSPFADAQAGVRVEWNKDTDELPDFHAKRIEPIGRTQAKEKDKKSQERMRWINSLPSSVK